MHKAPLNLRVKILGWKPEGTTKPQRKQGGSSCQCPNRQLGQVTNTAFCTSFQQLVCCFCNDSHGEEGVFAKGRQTRAPCDPPSVKASFQTKAVSVPSLHKQFRRQCPSCFARHLACRGQCEELQLEDVHARSELYSILFPTACRQPFTVRMNIPLAPALFQLFVTIANFLRARREIGQPVCLPARPGACSFPTILCVAQIGCFASRIVPFSNVAVQYFSFRGSFTAGTFPASSTISIHNSPSVLCASTHAQIRR